MSEIDKLKAAAGILRQVDITDIITNLGIGIAQAQEQLDKNSVKQAIALADPENGFGGKSLLELGFVPAFYSFQYADISAEIELKMRLATGFEIGGEVNVDFAKQGGYSKENLDFLRKDESSSHREEFKSSRNFSTTATNYESLTIESEEVVMEETEGVVNRLEKFNEDILSITTIDRSLLEIDTSKYQATNISATNGAIVQNSGGYIVITLPIAVSADEGILAIADYNESGDVEVDSSLGHEFEIGDDTGGGELNDFGSVYAAASSSIGSGTLIGFNAEDNMYYTSSGKAIELYFGFNKHNATLAMDQSLVDNDNSFSADNSAEKDMFLVLAKILDKDPNARIKITGYTDGSGDLNYNKLLSKRRADSLKDWLVDNGADKGQISTLGKGEDLAGSDQSKNLTYRKVIVEFITDTDYFYFKGGNFDANTATVTGGTENEFIYTEVTGGGASPNYTISFETNGSAVVTTVDVITSLTDITSLTAVQNNFSTEIIGNSAYLLHNEARIKYAVYSAQKENLVFQTGSNTSENFEDSESKYLIDETTNTSTRIKKDSENISNPSSVAVGVSVDARYSRQFSIDVSGNARVAARIVALPAPEAFMSEVSEVYNQ